MRFLAFMRCCHNIIPIPLILFRNATMWNMTCRPWRSCSPNISTGVWICIYPFCRRNNSKVYPWTEESAEAPKYCWNQTVALWGTLWHHNQGTCSPRGYRVEKTYSVIEELLHQKADLQARLNLIPHDGSPEVKDRDVQVREWHGKVVFRMHQKPL